MPGGNKHTDGVSVNVYGVATSSDFMTPMEGKAVQTLTPHE